jgi:hypothetical protein
MISSDFLNVNTLDAFAALQASTLTPADPVLDIVDRAVAVARREQTWDEYVVALNDALDRAEFFGLSHETPAPSGQRGPRSGSTMPCTPPYSSGGRASAARVIVVPEGGAA